jgi:hypothetical protein
MVDRKSYKLVLETSGRFMCEKCGDTYNISDVNLTPIGLEIVLKPHKCKKVK